VTVAIAQVHGVVLAGAAGAMVRVEVDVADGLPGVGMVGLPDTSVSEARWRARSAVESSGLTWPGRRITVNLSPAEVRKQGAGLDLPIAVGVLAADELVPKRHLGTTGFVGELGLDGSLRPTRGALAAALAARQAGLAALVVPSPSARELGRVSGIRLLLADTLGEVVAMLREDDLGEGQPWPPAPPAPPAHRVPDLADVRGQARGRLALEVAAAGGHHAAFIGPPGVGKTLLAQRLGGLLPDLDDEAALEVAVLHSVAGRPRPDGEHLLPPTLAPHHSASAASILGTVRGGTVVPGAVSLAHRGVLLLDEAPEFSRPALEGLRQPLEAGTVAVDRAGWAGLLPARFQLVLTANPCPCGQRVGSGSGCSCSPAAVRRYAARLSGPLLDRVDIRVTVTRPPDAELRAAPGEGTASVAARVQAARDRAAHRLAGTPWPTMARVPVAELRRRWPLDPASADLLADVERRSPNLRGPDRVLRLAWTLADLAGRLRPAVDDIALGASLRGAGTPWAA
jgi:magnesium chelatase family protein